MHAPMPLGVVSTHERTIGAVQGDNRNAPNAGATVCH